MKSFLVLIACGVSCTAMMAFAQASASPFRDSRQMLLVVTDGWDSIAGTVRRFERRDAGASWTPVGGSVPGVVGRNGLGWGRGGAEPAGAGPIKKEGDGKAPAGVFRLGTTFGQSPQPLSGSAMPYRFLGDDVECVDDVRSSHYNRLVTKQQARRVDWASSEKMWVEPLYKWGIVVEHNAEPAVAAAGSCIFLHIWKGPTSGTAGCTAMDEAALTDTIKWLDPKKSPVLVQLPRAEYERLKATWRLP